MRHERAVLLPDSSPISIWGFVELYCLRGTAGDNRSALTRCPQAF